MRNAIRKLLSLAALLLTLTAAAQKTYTVGMETRVYTDDTRRNYTNTGPRPLDTVIWYPADAASVARVPENAANGIFVAQPVAEKALLPTQKKYPLIVLSHGQMSVVQSMAWLAWYLAAHGYIVAGVNHHGNTGAEPQMMPQGAMLQWDRPRDLSVLIDKLETDPKFGPHIDTSRIGAAGHSAGGDTVIQVAGGRFDMEALQAFCKAHATDAGCAIPESFRKWIDDFNKIRDTDPVIQQELPHEHDSYRDPRVKAVIAMAPAVGHAFTAENLHSISIPVLIFTGTADDIVDPPGNADWYAANIPGAQIKKFPDAGHFVFGSECTPEGLKSVFICKERPGVDRAQIHATVEEDALKFFDRSLGIR